MKALLLVNPDAGRMRRITALRLAGLLEDFGLQVTLAPTSDPSEALSLVGKAVADSSRGCQRIVVAGGDGTIHSVLPALVKTSVPLAILPVGSVNVLARELALPRSLPEAARVAAQGVPRSIDLGRFSGQPFILMAGIGFDGAVVHTVRGHIKQRLGILTYLLNGLRLLLSHPPRRFRIICDDKQVETEAWQVVIANASSYTYRWTLAPQAKIDDGRLEVCVVPHAGASKRMKQVAAILLRRHRWAQVSYLSGSRIEIQSDRPVSVQLDGEPAASMDTAQIEIIPQGLTVMVGETR